MNKRSQGILIFASAARLVFWKRLVAALAMSASAACEASAADLPVPACAAGMERVWRQRCNKAVDQLKPAYIEALKSLQKKAVEEADFDMAKTIQSLIASLPEKKIDDPKDILCPGITSRIWKGGNMKRRIAPDGYHWRSTGNGPFQNQGQKMRSSAYGKDVLVHGSRNAPQLVWLLLDDKRVLELYWNDRFEIFTPDRQGGSSVQDRLAGLDAQFSEQCFVACEALTQKYASALTTLQKSLIEKGDMDGAMQLYAYLQSFFAGGTGGGKMPKELCGTWKEHVPWKYGIGATGWNFILSETGRGECSRPGGDVQYKLKYVDSSPWKGFHHFTVVAPGKPFHGFRFVFFRLDDRLYIVRPEDKRYIRELHPL